MTDASRPMPSTKARKLAPEQQDALGVILLEEMAGSTRLGIDGSNSPAPAGRLADEARPRASRGGREG